MTTHLNGWLTIAETCNYLKVTRATVYRWIRNGRLRSYRLGERGTRLRRADVDAMLSPNDLGEKQALLRLAESSFGKDWDNEQDAIYNNWKELYSVHDR